MGDEGDMVTKVTWVMRVTWTIGKINKGNMGLRG